jgi:hypothetical protein
MLVLRFATLLAIAVWVGGLLVLGTIAAPAIFEVVASRGVADGRLLSGAIFGEILQRFHLVAYGCGAVLLLSLFTRAVLGPRPRHFALRFGLAVLMLAATLYSGLVVSRQVTAVQAQIGTHVAASSLPEGDPRRVAFGRLHGLSTLLQLVPLIGGMALIGVELAD